MQQSTKVVFVDAVAVVSLVAEAVASLNQEKIVLNNKMDSKCTAIIENLKESYSYSEGFDEFLEYEESEGFKYFTIDLSSQNDSVEVANLTLSINPAAKEIVIASVVRRRRSENKTYKGVGKTLIYLAACKAIELDYTLKLSATPYSESNGLFNYYNSIGLVRHANGVRGTGRNRGLKYETSPAKLKEIIAKTGGTRKRNRKQ